MIIRGKDRVSHREKGEARMAEAYGWIFVGSVPLLYEKRRVARQLQVETWLDLVQVLKELGLEKIEKNGNCKSAGSAVDYIV